MSADTVIRLEGIGKEYVKYEDAPMLASALLRGISGRSRQSRLWAVRGVDMEVKAGECVGVIGRNGSGKSTLLQMISGITQPSEGRLRVQGRVAPLISVGVGFHPELSGRDNIFVNGAILGLTRRQIEQRFDDVVAFAEMEEFIDTPVKFYSSGMTVRLGFSMAIQATPDILLVDEVLAVGDVAFQLKCFERMNQIRTEGTTILVVSHNLNAVRLLADRGLLLHMGAVRYQGETAEAISQLHEILQEDREIGAARFDDQMPMEHEVLDVESIDMVVEGKSRRSKTNHVKTGDRVTLRVGVRALQDVAAPYLGFTVASASGVPVYSESNRRTAYPPLKSGDRTTFEASFDVRLLTGSYSIVSMIARKASHGKLFRLAVPPALNFYVSGRRGVRGIVDLEATYDTKPGARKRG